MKGYRIFRTAIRKVARPMLLAAAFLLLPVIVGAGIAGWRFAQFNQEPLSAPQGAYAPPSYDPDKPIAVVIAGNNGSEVTDFLGPYTVFSTSGEYNVYSVSPELRPAPLSGGLDILPHYSFDQFDQTFQRSPDLIVIPYLPNIKEGSDTAIVPWIRSHAGPNTLVLSICAGSSVLAETGLLDGLDSTIYNTWFRRVERDYPQVNWVRDVRWVDNGQIVSSAGITSGIDASLHVLDRQFGREKALEVAAALNYPHAQFLDDPAFQLARADITAVALNWLYSFGDKIGVVLYEGVDDLALGSVFDTYPGSATGQLFTVTLSGEPVRSRHGLVLLPRTRPETASGLDRVIVPGFTVPGNTLADAQAWASGMGRELEQPHRDAAGVYVYDATLADVARTEGRPIARYLARGLEYPDSHIQFSGRGYPIGLALRSVALALVGLVAVGWLTRRRTPPSQRMQASVVQG